MAKVKGIVTLQGTLGGVNYYQTIYGPIAREAGGGFNGDAIRTKASMKRVRENGSEFGHCSRVNKLFRQGIGVFYEHYKFAGLHGHLMRLFTRLKDLDPVNERGERRVGLGLATEAGKTLMRTFDYTPESRLSKVWPYKPQIENSDYKLRFTSIDMAKVTFPKGATHLKLLYGVLDIDFGSMTFERYAADPVLIDRSFDSHSLEIPLTEIPTITQTAIGVLGMRLYQQVDGILYPLHDEKFVGFEVVGSF
jgi:hypothetical protein